MPYLPPHTRHFSPSFVGNSSDPAAKLHFVEFPPPDAGTTEYALDLVKAVVGEQNENYEKGGANDHFAVYFVLEAPFALGRGLALFVPKGRA